MGRNARILPEKGCVASNHLEDMCQVIQALAAVSPFCYLDLILTRRIASFLQRSSRMPLDPYASCPCGSGKKFKWCCQPIHVQITKAFQLDAEGQHDAAMHMMDELSAEHSGNPEVWGRKAELLYNRDRPDDAETALQKALDLNPNYPFGHYLRGRFRQIEGEVPGALILFRRAAELYDPEARGLLSHIHAQIAECELMLNRPVAARAALEMAIRFDPTNDSLRQSMEQVFGETARFPVTARREQKYQSLPASAAPERRAAWEQALSAAANGKLSAAAAAFEKLVKEDENDAAAWFNLGLTRAWQGDNRAALEALDRHVALENDASRAGAAWALAEVLRCGQGLEDEADYVDNAAIFPARDPEALVQVLAEMEKERRLVHVQMRQEEGLLTGLILEKVTALTPELAARATPRLAANLLMAGNMLRVSNVYRDAWEAVVQELRQRGGSALTAPQALRGPAHFADVLSEGFHIPLGAADQNEAQNRVREGFTRYLEETWIHRPLKALNQIPPIDAAGHGTLRKKLIGAIQFLQECAELSAIPYDFDRIRQKLGLIEGAAAQAGTTASRDIAAMSTADLAALEPEALSDSEADQAYQAALKLDARELAGKFARNLIARPARADRPDRFPWYGQLVQLALAQGDTDAALNYLDEGEKADCTENEGRRRDDYELRRGQVHARRGDMDQAQDIFERLIARAPAELRFRSSAAEAMLSAKQKDRALRFAQAGLDQARKQNDRDSEEHFKELTTAAQR
jgi:tetratricopeptide (TPR) repeat protein